MRRAAALACCCFGWLGTANGGFVDPASVTSEHFFDEAVNAQDLFYAWRSLGHQLLLSDALPEGSTLAGALRLAGTDEPFPQEVFFATHDEDAVRDVLFHTLSSPAFQRLRDNAKRHSMERWAEPSDAVVDAVVALGADGDDSVGIDLLCALAGMHNSSADAAEASLEISIRLFTSPTFEAGFNALPACQGDFAWHAHRAQAAGPAHIRGTALAFSAAAIKSGMLPGTLDEAEHMARVAAFESNDPFAHIVLAVAAGEAQEDASKDGLAVKVVDCEAALAHLEAAADAVLDNIVNALTGALPRFDSVAQNFEDAVFSASTVDAFATKDEFETELLHLQDAAAADEHGALVDLADRLLMGAPHLGIDPRPEAARRLYARAADLGFGPAAAQLGFIALGDGDNKTAAEHFDHAVRLGDAGGHAGLGVLYIEGYPTRNATAALEHLLRASDGGALTGVYKAGVLLYYGLDEVKPDRLRGMALLEQAADKGHVMAAFDLARVLFSSPKADGSSCAATVKRLQSVVRADWSENVAFDPLQGMLAFAKGRERQALKVFALASELLWHSPLDAGFFFELGFDVHPSDFALPETPAVVEAAAAAAGEPWLRSLAVAVMGALGVGVRVPAWRQPGEQWRNPFIVSAYSRAFRQQSAEGTRKLADCYLEGWACARDHAKAAWLYKKAVQLGDGHAAVTLGVLRWRGLAGLARNRTAADAELALAEQLDVLGHFPAEAVRLVMWAEAWLWSWFCD